MLPLLHSYHECVQDDQQVELIYVTIPFPATVRMVVTLLAMSYGTVAHAVLQQILIFQVLNLIFKDIMNMMQTAMAIKYLCLHFLMVFHLYISSFGTQLIWTKPF